MQHVEVGGEWAGGSLPRADLTAILARAGHGPPRTRDWSTSVSEASGTLELAYQVEDLRLAPGAGVRELERALRAKVLAVAELVGTYER
jgi:hypothetical protein